MRPGSQGPRCSGTLSRTSCPARRARSAWLRLQRPGTLSVSGGSCSMYATWSSCIKLGLGALQLLLVKCLPVLIGGLLGLRNRIWHFVRVSSSHGCSPAALGLCPQGPDSKMCDLHCCMGHVSWAASQSQQACRAVRSSCVIAPCTSESPKQQQINGSSPCRLCTISCPASQD